MPATPVIPPVPVPASPLPPEVYTFGTADASRADTLGPAQLGFKAWNLLRMAELGLPVPPGLVLGTAWCQAAAAARPPAVWREALARLEQASGLRFGDERRPLLVSVRSGAPVSMPGMMQTLLDIGLCETTLPGFLRQTGHPRLVWDAYRRLVATYGETVARLDGELFEAELRTLAGHRDERDLDFSELRTLTRRYLALYREHAGQPFPQDPQIQLAGAIEAVFASWQSPQAQAYRAMHGIDATVGTAVTVQQMVFGNAGGVSGAGVGFTRDPTSGEPVPWVDFLLHAQGEDVVSGRRRAHGHQGLAERAPAVWQQLLAATRRVEAALGDMQDFEFTVQDGRLYLLQTRTGKRSARAAVRIALDLVEEGVLSAAQAAARLGPVDAAACGWTRIVAAMPGATNAAAEPLARAASAQAGVASGEIALDEARVRERRAAGVPVLLLRRDAETRDLAALELAGGLLTSRGARTAHAAVVARQLGKVCLVGCEALQIDEATRTVCLGERSFREGEVLTLDGNDGAVYAGEVRTETVTDADLLARWRRLGAARTAAGIGPSA